MRSRGRPGRERLASSSRHAPTVVVASMTDRFTAAVIDLVLIGVIFAVLGLPTGRQTLTSTTDPGIHVTTFGEWLSNPTLALLADPLWLLLLLAYYFVLEACFGRTIGKRLLSLRVVQVGGGRPSISAIAIRTVGRIIDVLPALYVLGMIVMATGSERQRIGDRLAHTTVATSLQPSVTQPAEPSPAQARKRRKRQAARPDAER